MSDAEILQRLVVILTVLAVVVAFLAAFSVIAAIELRRLYRLAAWHSSFRAAVDGAPTIDDMVTRARRAGGA